MADGPRGADGVCPPCAAVFTCILAPRDSGCGVLQRIGLRGVCRLDRFRICPRCVSAVGPLRPEHPTRQSIFSLEQCLRTCRRARSHWEGQQRPTTFLARYNCLPSCRVENPFQKTKRVFVGQARHQCWPGRFPHHRNTPHSGPRRRPLTQVKTEFQIGSR
jgi:hypothetical protein